MKAHIDVTRNGDEIRITRYYDKVGQTLPIPIEDIPELTTILLRFLVEQAV